MRLMARTPRGPHGGPPPRTPDADLARRLAEIDRLPLSFEGRALARLACRINALETLPPWLSAEECQRLGDAVVLACHGARVPVARLRRLVDPDAAAWEARVLGVMRPRD